MLELPPLFQKVCGAKGVFTEGICDCGFGGMLVVAASAAARYSFHASRSSSLDSFSCGKFSSRELW